MADPPSDPLRARAVIVAAGDSVRMADGAAEAVRKPWLELDGRTVLEASVEAFHRCEEVVEIVIVTHRDDVARAEELVEAVGAFAKVTAVVPGGAERIDSVRNGVRASTTAVDVVAIHDAARPLIEPGIIAHAIRLAAAEGASLVATAVRDTVKRSRDGRHAHETLEREGLWLAQTPQCFAAERFLDLLERADRDGFHPTDDAALWERYVGPVPFVIGGSPNPKITTSADLATVRGLFAARRRS